MTVRNKFIVVIFFIIVIGWVIAAYQSLNNPRKYEIDNAYLIINKDISDLLDLGGVVLSKSKYQKGGRFSLGGMPSNYQVYIANYSWTDTIDRLYKDKLINLGWRSINTERTRFCKQGIEANLNRYAGKYLDKDVGLIEMNIFRANHGVCYNGQY